MKKRIEELDIIKAICITGIVFAHAGHSLGWIGYFYVYGFYFVAGVTWRDKPFSGLLTAKIKRIYIPFVIANLIAEIFCIFLHNYTDYYGGTYPFRSYMISILMFNLKENIMAPSWFLFPLFCIPFLFFFLRKAVKNDGMLFLITFLLFITATLCRDTLNQIQWNNCAVITNLAIGLFIFTCGFVYGHNNQIKHYLTNGKYAFELFLLSVFILFEAKYYWNYSCNMRAGTFSNTVWTFILCPAGICFLIYFSHAVVEKGSWIKKILTCIGKRSMSIMFFHVLSFSLVTLAGIYLFHSTYEPSWTNAFHGTWYPYINAGVGLTVPLAADFLIETIRKKVHI